METLKFGPIQRFLLWAAGFDAKTASHTESAELNKMGMYGTLVLVPPVIALFSYGYFIYSLSENMLAAGLGAIAVSFLLLLVERSVMGIGNPGEFTIGLGVRLLIAAGMSLLISEPIIFYFYKDDVTEMLYAEQKQTEDDVEARYANQLSMLSQDSKNSTQHLEDLRMAYTIEADGSGGTGNRGKYDIYDMKKADYDVYKKEHDAIIAVNNTKIADVKREIAIEKEEAVEVISKSPFKQMRLLNRLSKTDDSVFYVTWFFRVLLLLIEILPMAMKVSMRKMYYHQYEEDLAELRLKFFQGQKDERLELLLRSQQNEYERQRNKLKLERMNDDATHLNNELDVKAKVLQDGLKTERNLHKTNSKYNADDELRHKRNGDRIEGLLDRIINFVSGNSTNNNPVNE
ncbi:MAG: DUF4407 domain-containing protein [Flavobacteriaceae bacterium]|nr:DUF4407 domain-containing protein [Flavobacteriaceae bacterium]